MRVKQNSMAHQLKPTKPRSRGQLTMIFYKEADSSIVPVSFTYMLRHTKEMPYADDLTSILDGIYMKTTTILEQSNRSMGKERLTGAKSMTGPTWLCLTSTNIHARNYLVPHD